MQKPFALILAVCFSLTGCQVFEKSETWEKVTQVRPGDWSRDPDPSAAYAEKLHRVLLESGVEHLVVTYQYHYLTFNREEAVGTRTAVVYRDNATRAFPWWLKDDRLNTPIWLPNGELAKQIGFYIRAKAEVIEQKAYPAGGRSGKATVALSEPLSEPFAGPAHATADTHAPTAVTKIAPAKPAPAPAAREPVAVVRSTKATPIVSNTTTPAAPATAPAPPTILTKIERTFATLLPRPKATADTVSPAPVAEYRNNPGATAPVVTDSPATTSEPATTEGHFEKLFRIQNGTSYDRTSSMDRRKMEQLKHGMVGKEASGEHELSHGPDGSLIHPQF